MTLITEFQYFPSVILYKKLNNFSNIIFDKCEYYRKMTFRNRCRIAGAEGTIDLSIPLEKGRDQRSLIRDVRISGSRKWQGEHWKTILSCYSRSPWFEFYRDELEKLYRRPAVFLMDWNLACFEWSIRVLGMPVEISFTDARHKTSPEEGLVNRPEDGQVNPLEEGRVNPLKGSRVNRPEEGQINPQKEWTDWRNKILPKTSAQRQKRDQYAKPEKKALSGAGGRSEARDLQQGESEPQPVIYRQVFEERTGFLPGLSILDLLFCEGKNARRLLA
jgi:hypothetical protein